MTQKITNKIGILSAMNDRVPGLNPPMTRRKLRIGVTSHFLPVAGLRRGGVDRVAHELAHGLAERGHSVTVWSYDPRPNGARYETRPLPARWFATSWLGQRLTMGYLGNFLTMVPELRHYDAIVAHGDSLLLPLLRRPVVRVMHGSALGEARSAKSPARFVMQLGVYVQELLSAATQYAVGVSKNTQRYNPFVRRVIALGVDLSKFRPDPSERSAEPSILFVGTLAGRKRGALLLRTFEKEIRPRIPNATLTIVRDAGPAAAGVTYRIGVDDAELALLYRRAWVYASPSSYEGFGLPYLEAMASGTPVIATPNPGSREVLDNGRFGVLADDAEFGPALMTMLTDVSQRTRLADAGLKRAQEYSLAVTIDSYENLLLEVVNQRMRETRWRKVFW